MPNKVECEGLDELIKVLDKMGAAGQQIAEKAVIAGGNVILNRMKGKIYTVLKRRSSPSALDQLSMSEPMKDKKGNTAVYVGVGPDDISDIYYLKFSEYGSAHEPAKPWMRPAFDEAKEEAIKAMEKTVNDELVRMFEKGR